LHEKCLSDFFSVQPLSSLCSVVKELFEKTTTETPRTQRLHREIDFSCKAT